MNEKLKRRWAVLLRKGVAIQFRDHVHRTYGPDHREPLWAVLKRSPKMRQGIEYAVVELKSGNTRRFITGRAARHLERHWQRLQEGAHSRVTFGDLTARRRGEGRQRFADVDEDSILG